MTSDEINKLLRKSLQYAPERGVFPLLSCVARVIDNRHDDEKLLSAFRHVKELFLTKYGHPDKSGHAEFFELSDAGRRLKAQPLDL